MKTRSSVARRSEDTSERTTFDAAGDDRANWGVVALLVYLGFATGLPGYLDFEIGRFSIKIVAALGAAAIGWRTMPADWPALRRYFRWSAALAFWFCVSSVAAWNVTAMYWSAMASAWLVFIVPGMANLLRIESYRKALLCGVLAAAMAYAGTSLMRLAAGREIFDEPTSRALILGVKRSYVNARLLYVIPFLVAGAPQLFRRARWLGAAAAVGAILVSGARTGLLGLAIVALVLVVTQPGSRGKLRAILVGALLGLLLITAVGELGGQALVGKNRLMDYIRGERTTSDDVRELQFNRAWRVGLEHPAFGIGYHGLQDLDHPSLDQAKDGQLRRRAQEGGVHNTYIEIFGEYGIPAAALFLLLLASLVRTGIANNHIREMRAATAGFVALLMTMLFDPLSLEFLYFPMAYMLGTLGNDNLKSEEARPLSNAVRAP